MQAIAFRNGINQNMLSRVGAKAQPSQMEKLIASLNLNAQQNSKNYDTVEFSRQAKELLNEKAPKTTKAIDYENSPIVGERSQAEWAESALTQQRNGVRSIKGELAFQRKRLDVILSKIDESEKIANGEISPEDTIISVSRAEERIESYRGGIRNDFSKEISDTIEFYNGWVKQYDAASNGLASSVMNNVLENISAETLGLNDLSKDPAEIATALDRAIEKLDGIQHAIEDTFYRATGGEKHMLNYDSAETRNDIDRWEAIRMDYETARLESATIDRNVSLTGETIKIGWNWAEAF